MTYTKADMREILKLMNRVHVDVFPKERRKIQQSAVKQGSMTPFKARKFADTAINKQQKADIGYIGRLTGTTPTNINKMMREMNITPYKRKSPKYKKYKGPSKAELRYEWYYLKPAHLSEAHTILQISPKLRTNKQRSRLQYFRESTAYSYLQDEYPGLYTSDLSKLIDILATDSRDRTYSQMKEYKKLMKKSEAWKRRTLAPFEKYSHGEEYPYEEEYFSEGEEYLPSIELDYI